MNDKPMYSVFLDTIGCDKCGHGDMWTIIDRDEICLGQSWGDKDLVEDICDHMNSAHERALEGAKKP